ncbi:hypothetical protein [Hymenobacter guriensis]|uniref:Lipoprotein n=1 Tax=Hymenobacter guriensis TaxID=2793065 RepID=A0ABS0L5D2_9BACT|nr:hypothetical protein [Hymenobacter guriensis]MBG8555135.1 hypothetical protein [Hymenobacter guriensis]
MKKELPYWILLVFGLLIGCRSEKAAFQLRQPQLLVAQMDTTGSVEAYASLTTAIDPVSALRRGMFPRERLKQLASHRQVHYNRRFTARIRQIAVRPARLLASKDNVQQRHLPAPGKAAPVEMKKPASLGEVIFVIGSCLMLSGIIVGLIIGGSTGFTVGASLVGIGLLMGAVAYGGIK